jgi:hypothetical protein
METLGLNVSSFPIEKIKIYDKIGLGVNQFTRTQKSDSAFDDTKCYINEEEAPAAEYHTVKNFVTTQKELTNAIEKERGVSFDFGFGSVGHHSTTITETKISEKSLNLLINTTRSGASKIFDFHNNKNCFTEQANTYINEGNKEAFYNRYGSKYISKALTGYYVHILLTFTCDTKEEVKSKKSKLEATFKSEDGTVKAKLSNNKEFKDFYSKNEGELSISHNIPPELIKEINDYEALNELEKMLKLSEHIELFNLDKASIINYEITEKYPLIDIDFFGDFNNIETELYSLSTQIEKSQTELDTIKEFNERSFIYEKVDKIVERRTFFEKKLKSCQELAKLLVDNPWAKSNRVVELRKITTENNPYEELILKNVIIPCIVSSTTLISGKIKLTNENKVLSLDEYKPTGYFNSIYAINSLGIVLSSQIQNSGLSVNYDVEMKKPIWNTKHDKVIGFETSNFKGNDGSIVQWPYESNAVISKMSVWLTGKGSKEYNIRLNGIGTNGKPSEILEGLSPEKTEMITIGSPVDCDIFTISLYLEPKGITH